MILIPFDRSIDWSRPPVVTITLILINLLLYFGWQGGEHQELLRAVEYWQESGLAAIELVLSLREDAREFLDIYRLRGLVSKYSDFIEHPIVMEVEREEDGETKREDEVLNRRKAIWLRPAGEVSEDEHAEFYKQLAHDFHAPVKTIHFNAEGTIEFKALLYLPESAPWEQLFGEYRQGLVGSTPRHHGVGELQIDLRQLWVLHHPSPQPELFFHRAAVGGGCLRLGRGHEQRHRPSGSLPGEL